MSQSKPENRTDSSINTPLQDNSLKKEPVARENQSNQGNQGSANDVLHQEWGFEEAFETSTHQVEVDGVCIGFYLCTYR